MAFLKNAWYVAAWSAEVQAGSLLARRLIDEPIVIYRHSDGRARALTDRCPHRFAPLSMGRLVDGVVQCADHGLRFDGSGACVGGADFWLLKPVLLRGDEAAIPARRILEKRIAAEQSVAHPG